MKDYPKDKDFRRIKLSSHIATKIDAHVQDAGMSDDDLLFSHSAPADDRRPLRAVPAGDALGLTEPNTDSRRYRHGSLSGYSAGNCRCQNCKDAYAIYRAGRRAAGRDFPRRRRTVDTDGHIPRDWFRNKIWKPALHAAGLEFHVRPHDLRQAHASWLLAGGADLQVVTTRTRQHLHHREVSAHTA